VASSWILFFSYIYINLRVSVEGIEPKLLKVSQLPPTQLLILCWNCWKNMP